MPLSSLSTLIFSVHWLSSRKDLVRF